MNDHKSIREIRKFLSNISGESSYDMNNNLNIRKINELLSNDECNKKSQLHSYEINNDNELVNNPVKQNSFQMGFYAARKILNDYINGWKNNNTQN